MKFRSLSYAIMVAGILSSCQKKTEPAPEPQANNMVTNYVGGLENSERQAAAAAALATRKENQVDQKTQSVDSN